VQREELRAEVGAEIIPIDKVGTSDICGCCFPLVDLVGPFLGSPLVHVGHSPLDFSLFVRKLIRTQAEVRLTGIMKPFPFCLSPSKLGGGAGFKSIFGRVAGATGSGVWVCGSGVC